MRKLLSTAAIISLLAGSALAQDKALRAFTVADSIQMSTFLAPDGELAEARARTLTSPDGKRLLAVTLRGDLTSGKRIATLWVVNLDQVKAFLNAKAGPFAGARPIAAWSSASNETPATQWTWSKDSSAVFFLGADDEAVRRLYRVSADGGEPQALTPEGKDVTQFDERGGVVAYLAHDGVKFSDTLRTGGPELPDIVPGRGWGLTPLLLPVALDQQWRRWTDTLWLARDGVSTQVMDPSGKPVTLRGSRVALTADGRSVIASPFAKHVPKAWEQYIAPNGQAWARFTADPDGATPAAGNEYRARQYVSIDLGTGKATPLLDAPIDGDTPYAALDVAAGPEGRIALVGAYTPLSDKPADNQTALPCALTVLAGPGGDPACLERSILRPPGGPTWADRRQIVALRWSTDGHVLVADRASPNAPEDIAETLYVERNGRWSVAPRPVASKALVSVSVREAYDQPPALVATRSGSEPRVLLDPNPALKTLKIGSIEAYSWPTPKGPTWTGALVKPPNFVPGRRYPLIIQTHGLDKSRYLISGPSASGFAAQALASRGFMVLQVEEGSNDVNTAEENATGAESYIAAARQLAKEGLVDPTRVGITAWSHYGPHAMQALLREPKMFAAAVFAEASYTSYPVYLNNIDYLGDAREDMYRRSVGPRPFGDGLQTWLQKAEGFRLDGLCAPALIEIFSPSALAYGWSNYAAIAAQHKPADLLYIRNGAHVLVKPPERLAAQERVVDWYDYWINGARSADPAKTEQYALWDRLKAGARCGDAPVKAAD